MGQSPKTYDVGADLTTEDRVLGDHNDESLVDDRRYFIEMCLAKQPNSERSKTKPCGNRKRRTGLAGRQRRRVPGLVPP